MGNALNSVNVSSSLVIHRVKASKAGNLGRVAALLKAHADSPADFLANDPKGRQLAAYVGQLDEHLTAERQEVLNELGLLAGNIEHIKEIVARQENNATTVSGVRETLALADLLEEAVRFNLESLERHGNQDSARVWRSSAGVP